jgi:membrane protease YdiL (CAAX protease family)
VALVEVGLCSDVPTQMLSAAALRAFGFAPLAPGGQFHIGFVAPLLALDSLLLVGLILMLLGLRRERPGRLLLGERPWLPEARLSIPVTVGVLVIASLVLLVVRTVAPGLQTVDPNPFEALATTPADAVVFALVGMLAGGVREEIQRAFVLRRFERYLGGSTVGIVVSSAAFGAGHLLQGADTGIVTAALGAFWGTLYLRRGSVVAPVLSHAMFNTLQVGAIFVTGR